MLLFSFTILTPAISRTRPVFSVKTVTVPVQMDSGFPSFKMSSLFQQSPDRDRIYEFWLPVLSNAPHFAGRFKSTPLPASGSSWSACLKLSEEFY